MRGYGCVRCGDCCTKFKLDCDVAKLRYEGTEQYYLDCIKDRLGIEVVPRVDALKVVIHTACIHYNKEERLCGIYDDRPKLCRIYCCNRHTVEIT